MKRKLRIVLFTVVLVFVAAPYLQAVEQPIVVYSLQFIELDAELAEFLQAKFSLNEPQKNKKWQVISRDEILKYIHKEGKFSALLRGGAEQESSQVHYNSWLTAVNKEQAAVELKEKLINESGETGQAHLKFYFQPLQIESEKDRVLTKVKFSYQGRRGEQIEAETKSWISQQKKQPVAVVTQQVKSNKNTTRRYFALYIKGTTVSSGGVKQENALVAMGDLKEVNQLFGRKDKSSTSSNLELAGYLNKKVAEVKFNWQMNKYKLRAGVRKNEEELFYQADMGYSLLGIDDLFVLGRIGREMPEQGKSVVRLGLRDKVTWRNLINLEVAYFPVFYRVGSKVKKDSAAEVELGLEAEKWKAWYAGRYAHDSYFNGGGVSYNLASNWELASKWEENHSGNGKIYLGLIWKLSE